MEVLTINGKQFVKATNVAREFGYTSDYVGQLARSGAVNAERVGRAWYVDREQVAAHKGEKRRSVAARARAGLVERVHVVRHKNDTVRHVSGISYHDDDAPLMPQISPMSPQDLPTSQPEIDDEQFSDEVLSNEVASVTQEEEPKDGTHTHHVPIRKIEDSRKIPITIKNRQEVPYGEYQIQKQKQVPTVVFAKPQPVALPAADRSNTPYILLMGLMIVILFAGMYTYTEGTAKRTGVTKSYGVSVVIVESLTSQK